MTTYVSVLTPCLVCHVPFYCNPNHVPSLVVDGVREPVCADCMALVNAKRVQLGHEPFIIHPDAYAGEPEHLVVFGDD